MSQFSGPQGRNARRARKTVKREEAEARNKHYRENIELAERFANSAAIREAAIDELMAENE